MEAELYARLNGDTAIAALIAGAIYPLQSPKEAVAPFIVWQRVSGVPLPRALDAESAITSARVQIDSYGVTYAQARALADAVRACLLDWSGTGGAIQLVTFENDRALRETDPALKTFRVSQDFIILFVS
jgi:hypothetical protein